MCGLPEALAPRRAPCPNGLTFGTIGAEARYDPEMQHLFTKIAGKTAIWMGHPSAFIGATLACIVWAVSGPFFNYSDTHKAKATALCRFGAVAKVRN